ncbi:MAG: ABC transporter ATP-binding protein [Chloroflexi bacterium]|nr:ABC transporter ATP-binding protein [Chloroflexota bacterium]MBP8059049.1 ABC transporter ATP-binding protein [Chloroflexota bacterium]
MSKQPILQFDQVSKCFDFASERPRTLLETVIHTVVPGRRREWQAIHQGVLWALKDVSFSVKPGESLGIIGRNGSGKSTLLKLASRILKPTAGKVDVRGRVSALLELGAGFHPDLTGKENIYLNGSLLGLTRQEVEKSYQAIVDFSELHDYIHMPVKHYSSGMYMRLGFSVAIHVQPEILIIDEILAVGDQAFQNKCIERVYELIRSGMTVVMVSHSLESIRGICSRAIWIENGEMRASGTADDVIGQYMTHSYAQAGIQTAPDQNHPVEVQTFSRWGSREVEITGVRILNAAGEICDTFKTNDPLTLEMAYIAHAPIQDPIFGLAIFRTDGVHVNGPNVRHSGLNMGVVQGSGVLRYQVERLPLLPAHYQVTVAVYDSFIRRAFDHHDRAYPLRVIGGGTKEIDGVVTIPATWEWEPGEKGAKW